MQSPFPFGAVPLASGTRFSLWARGVSEAEVEVEGGGRHSLTPDGQGGFSGVVEGVGVGARYRFRLDGGAALPDVASRWQPEGSDGPSVVVGDSYPWTDAAWRGIERQDQVLYELHIGTFTEAGTWTAAAERLEHLRDLGITVLQVMPAGSFKGRFGWGYDTTQHFAPFAPYGTPDDLRAFVDRAHAMGLGVILDVVYNHVGTGDHFCAHGDGWFADGHSEWGWSFRFDAPHSQPVRDFVVANAAYWIQSFHFDGLRIDAAQALLDDSPVHILTEIAAAVRRAAGARQTYLIVENQPQDHRMIDPPEAGGHGLDAMYNDDFHHAVHVAATGHNDFYYRDYLGTPQEILSALKYGFLYQGQRSEMRQHAYGTENLDTPPEAFIHFLENHDQVANSARGFRMSTLVTPARLRALTALVLLGPQTPRLFQGEEFGSTRPFLYFLGLEGEEAAAVAEGRRAALTQFPGVADPAMQARLRDPAELATFEASKLDWRELEANAPLVQLHRDLLALRRDDPSFSQRTPKRVDGAVLSDAALLLRYITPDPDGHRLLLLNLGRDLPVGVVAEPLLAPPRGRRWRNLWSSEHPQYGGTGRRGFDGHASWTLAGDSLLVLAPEPAA